MQNLDQIRAAKADSLCKPRPGQTHPDFDRSDVVGIPALILSNGLLAAAAFCCEVVNNQPKRPGMSAAFKGIAEHLSARGLITASTGQEMIRDLATKDSLTLQRATTETLAFLAYLKRFAVKKEKSPTI